MAQAHEAIQRPAEPVARRKQEEAQPTETSRPHPFLLLQRAAGNQAVLRLIESHNYFQDAPETTQPGYRPFAPRPVAIQTKLAISQPNDPAEREADDIVKQVVRSPQLEREVPAEKHRNELPRLPLEVQRKSIAVSNPTDAAEKEADEVSRKVIEGQSAEIHGTPGTISRGDIKIHRKINIAGKLDYAPGQPSAKLKGFTKLAIEALNEINQGTTGVDGPVFLENLTNPKATYDVTMEKSDEYNPEGNKLSDVAGDLSAGGVLKWNPNMGLIMENAFMEKPANTEQPGNDALNSQGPATAEPEKQNAKMSPIRVLLHELDHADRSNFIKPIITNLGNSAIEDKFQGLTPEQRSFLEQRFANYPIEAGWIRDEITYKEVKGSIIREFNSEKGEEGRVVKGSETRSGETMKEGTRTHYDTGVTGLYKARGFKSTEEGIASDTEKESIKAENARIKAVNAQIEEERRTQEK